MRDKEAAAEKERMRQIKIDIAGNDDTDDELPAWQRRPYSTRWVLSCANNSGRSPCRWSIDFVL